MKSSKKDSAAHTKRASTSSNRSSSTEGGATTSSQLGEKNGKKQKGCIDAYAHLTDNERAALVTALSEQAFHLPGNTTWWQDWRQYFGNNHPLFGICFHHSLHPITWKMRCLHLLASIVFGLTVTNIIWLWCYEDDAEWLQVDLGSRLNLTDSYVQEINDQNQIEVTKSMVILWTLGASLHAWFDNLIWTLSLCACCSRRVQDGGPWESLQKYRKYGVGLVTFFSILLVGLATLIVVIRATVEDGGTVQVQELRSAGLVDDMVAWDTNTDGYEFMISFGTELFMAMFVHFPLVGTILFSGILLCGSKKRFVGKLVGGRRYELQEIQRAIDKQNEAANTAVEVELGEDPTRGEDTNKATKQKKTKNKKGTVKELVKQFDV